MRANTGIVRTASNSVVTRVIQHNIMSSFTTNITGIFSNNLVPRSIYSDTHI